MRFTQTQYGWQAIGTVWRYTITRQGGYHRWMLTITPLGDPGRPIKADLFRLLTEAKTAAVVHNDQAEAIRVGR